MSRFEKALDRLLAKPRDFTWQELRIILGKLGYVEHKGAGSRRKFINPTTGHVISLHEPHPRPTLKAYAIHYVIEELKKQNVI